MKSFIYNVAVTENNFYKYPFSQNSQLSMYCMSAQTVCT